MPKSELKERIAVYLRHKNITAMYFEREVGVANGWCTRPVESLTRKTINKISAAFPDLSIDWLLKGEGEMLVELPRSVTYTDNSSHNRYDNSAVGCNNIVANQEIEGLEWRKAILEVVAKGQDAQREMMEAQFRQNKEFLETIRLLVQSQVDRK